MDGDQSCLVASGEALEWSLSALEVVGVLGLAQAVDDPAQLVLAQAAPGRLGRLVDHLGREQPVVELGDAVVTFAPAAVGRPAAPRVGTTVQLHPARVMCRGPFASRTRFILWRVATWS